MFLETPFSQMREWVKNLPNEGLIRYYIVGNLERILLTSPKALSEMLVTNVYDFEKPEVVRNSLRRITVEGILLAEGEEHKVSASEDALSSPGRLLTSLTIRSNAKTLCQRFPTAILRIYIRVSGPRVWRWSR